LHRALSKDLSAFFKDNNTTKSFKNILK